MEILKVDPRTISVKDWEDNFHQFNLPDVIAHFYRMQKQAEKKFGTKEDPRAELGDWHRGFYAGERGAYKHCVAYLDNRDS